jgi:hypothetical protein
VLYLRHKRNFHGRKALPHIWAEVMVSHYFLASGFDILPPPNGSLELGHVVDDPTSDFPLNPISRRAISKVYGPDNNYKDGFKATRKQLRDGKAGIWTKLFEASAKLSISHAKSQNDVFTVKRMQTMYFNPDRTYVEETMQAEDVKEWAESTRYKKPVFMITGLKIAKGACWSHSATDSHGVEMEAAANGNMAAAPASGLVHCVAPPPHPPLQLARLGHLQKSPR